MAAELMLINPRRKRRVTRVKRNPRRRMSALQAKYFGPRRRKAAARRRAPARITRVQTNPRPRRRRRSIMRVRRNPTSIKRATGKITSALVPAAAGAGGAIALNYAWNQFSGSLPASVQSGIGMSIAQIAAGIGLGMVAGMAFGKTVGTQVAAGAITVTLYNLAQTYVSGIGTNAGGYTYSGSGNSYYGADGTTMNGLARKKRHRNMRRYVGAQMNGNLPRGLNGMQRYVGKQMNGNLPRGLNGMGNAMGGMGAAGPMHMRRGRRMNGMGYMGPARIVGR